MNNRIKLGVALFAASVCSAVQASVYTVDAYVNSSSGGTPVNSIFFTAGMPFSVTVSPADLWSAGALPRWSNANGLTGDLFATGTDESGEVAGTKIGTNFGPYTQDGFTAPYGALVGKIGSSYLLLGTSFSGVAPESGTLNLLYWDSNNGDNNQYVTATIHVPEGGSTCVLVGMALLGLGFLRFKVNFA